ncbi:hypothetical protein [Paenibacillus dokdonensis]|uniref:hypothetical protein n=1 Tax=Paenibacillus dokdonensis TaxID=2567944 RepID=UPI0010A7D320|nr:hypothetical protein [Paenibacillus dokdonensis]
MRSKVNRLPERDDSTAYKNEPSRHLRSRLEVEQVLGSYGVPVTTLHAGLIVFPFPRNCCSVTPSWFCLLDQNHDTSNCAA